MQNYQKREKQFACTKEEKTIKLKHRKRKGRRKMKKFMALFLTMLLALSLAVSAYAEEGIMPISLDEEPQNGDIVILHTNDVHGAVDGYAYVAALKDYYEAQGSYVLLLDAGDFAQGAAEVTLSEGAAAIELMNMAGYDAATFGNHELDYGYENAAALAAAAKFPIVSANIRKDGKNILPAHTVFTAPDGRKIGVFGLETPETATKLHPAKIQGLEFTGGDALFACAQSEVDALRAEGCDYVVCLGHLGIVSESVGWRSVDLLNAVGGIDVFIDAHSHSTPEQIAAVTDNGRVGKSVLTSTGEKLERIGVVTISGETITAANVAVANLSLAPNEAVAAYVASLKATVEANYGEIFARSEVSLNGIKAPMGNRDSETNNGDLIADAMRWYAIKDGGLAVDDDHVIALVNGGSIRAAIEPGEITKKDIKNVLPFGNTLSIVYVSGEVLLEALEASTFAVPGAVGAFPQVAGLSFTLDTTKAYDAQEQSYPGSTYYGPKSITRVSIDSVNGKTFDPKATYAVATNDFCAAGGDTYYAFAATETVETGTPLDTVVIEYITSELGGVIDERYAKPQGRITVKRNLFLDTDPAAWYYDSVSYCVTNSLMNGTSADTFTPHGTTTRGQIAAVIYRMAQKADKGFGSAWTYHWPYSDVEEIPEYAHEAAAWCTMNQIILGYDDGTFSSEDPVTREQLAAILYRYAKYMGYDVSVGEDTNILSYDDAFDICEYAIPAFQWSCGAGVIGGSDGKLMPDASAERVQVAAVMQRFCENVAK